MGEDGVRLDVEKVMVANSPLLRKGRKAGLGRLGLKSAGDVFPVGRFYILL
jgi:hypothetical protein